MSVIGEGVVAIVQGEEKIRVSRRDRRLVRAAFALIALLAVTDAVLYLSLIV